MPVATSARQPAGARRGMEIASLVLCWLVLTLILAAGIWAAAEARRWQVALEMAGLFGLWATLTALIVRRLWPRSRAAGLLADPKHERLEKPMPHGGLVLVVVVVGAALFVLACLHFGWS